MYFPEFSLVTSPDISYRFYCVGATKHVYCVALVWAPRHIVQYACVAQTARALYSCPLAPLRYEFLKLNFGIRVKKNAFYRLPEPEGDIRKLLRWKNLGVGLQAGVKKVKIRGSNG